MKGLLRLLLILAVFLAGTRLAAAQSACTDREANSEPCFLDPGCFAHTQKSGEFESKGDIDAALAELRAAIKLRPGTLLWLKLGELLQQRDPQESLAILRQIPAARLCEETAAELRKAIADAEAAAKKTPSQPNPTLAATNLVRPPPVVKRWQLWVGVAGAVAAVGLAVGLGIGLSAAASTPQSPSSLPSFPPTPDRVYLP